jgi:uncharacterized membrane protein YqiK
MATDFVFFVVAILMVVALIGLLLWFFFLWYRWASIRVRESASAEGCSAAAVAGGETTGQQAPQVSGSDCEAS